MSSKTINPSKKNRLNIAVLHGSIRPGNSSQHIAKFVAEELKSIMDAEVTLIEPAKYTLDLSKEGWGAAPVEIMTAFEQSDAVVFVVPEYNHGYPASLKFILDSTTGQLANKVAAFVGVSVGAFGGTRLIEALNMVTRELKMVSTHADLQVSAVQSIVGADGISAEGKETLQRRIQPLRENLLFLAHAMRQARVDAA